MENQHATKFDIQIGSLLQLWRAERVGIPAGNTLGKIQDFERRNGVVLPQDLKSYLLATNGMYPEAQQDTDRRGFCFWPLEHIVSVFADFKKNPAHKSDELDESLKSYFVFADYLQRSWVYAIRLTNRRESLTEIAKVDEPKRLIKIGDSFSEFIDLYLNDSRRLYDPLGGVETNRK